MPMKAINALIAFVAVMIGGSLLGVDGTITLIVAAASAFGSLVVTVNL